MHRILKGSKVHNKSKIKIYFHFFGLKIIAQCMDLNKKLIRTIESGMKPFSIHGSYKMCVKLQRKNVLNSKKIYENIYRRLKYESVSGFIWHWQIKIISKTFEDNTLKSAFTILKVVGSDSDNILYRIVAWLYSYRVLFAAS